VTAEEKKQINARINELMGILAPTGSLTDAVIFVHGDAEHQNAAFSIHGDSRLLANAIQHNLSANEEFKRFMFAMFGSYLSGNPEDEKAFLNGLVIVKNNLGTNFKN